MELPPGRRDYASRVAVHRIVVDVMLKPEILDPQGQAVANALPRLGFASPESLRIGRHVELSLEASDATTALEQATKIADTLLANPVIEDYTVRLA
ncbi:MAG: phosphoribosylformylglycinamidine synthase [Frankiales bacterium]|nr:phosphoribosylformylglycinamidine synthase [Frankiales bacterium]